MKKILLVVTLLACTACSFKSPLSKNGAGLRIKIDKKPKRNEMFLQDTLRLSGPIKDIFKNRFNMMVAATPVDETDFNCFAVNVTGPAIPSVNNFDESCTINDNMNGHGVGFLSDPVEAGEPIDIMVTAGTDRRIDVYGLFPDVAPCSHEDGNNDNSIPTTTDGGYYLGGTTVDITEPKTVNVGISYDSTPASVSCTHHDNGYYFKFNYASATRGLAENQIYSAAGSALVNGSPLSGQTYIDPDVDNYDDMLFQADTATSTMVFAANVDYVSDTDLDNITSINFNYYGAGGDDSTCTAVSTPIGGPTMNVKIWNSAYSTITSFNSVTLGNGTATLGSLTSFSSYVYTSGGHRYILVAIEATGTNPCIKIQNATLELKY